MIRLIRCSTLKKLYKQKRDLEIERLRLHALQFRVGDQIFISDGERDPRSPYFIRDLYHALGGSCAHISKTRDAKTPTLSDLSDSCRLVDASPEPPEQCTCCGHLLEESHE